MSSHEPQLLYCCVWKKKTSVLLSYHGPCWGATFSLVWLNLDPIAVDPKKKKIINVLQLSHAPSSCLYNRKKNNLRALRTKAFWAASIWSNHFWLIIFLFCNMRIHIPVTLQESKPCYMIVSGVPWWAIQEASMNAHADCLGNFCNGSWL